MGFTPLEGLVIGTRCGDIDAGLLTFLARKEHAGMDTIEEWLNKRSGLLGISSLSPDTRDLVRHAADNPGADLALEVFSYRVKKYIGAYVAAWTAQRRSSLGAESERTLPRCAGESAKCSSAIGLQLDRGGNESTVNREGCITRDGSRVAAFVIPTDEGLMIAHEAVICCAAPLGVHHD